MGMDTARLTRIIAAFDDPDDESRLAELENAVQALADSGTDAAAIAAMLAVLERFPDRDGFGVFWTILHALEHFGGYEDALRRSVLRAPAPFTVLMVNRLLNAGGTPEAMAGWLEVLQTVVNSSVANEAARRDAADFLRHQQQKGMS